MSLWEANGGKSRFGQPHRPEFSLSQSHKVPEAYGPVVPKKTKTSNIESLTTIPIQELHSGASES